MKIFFTMLKITMGMYRAARGDFRTLTFVSLNIVDLANVVDKTITERYSQNGIDSY